MVTLLLTLSRLLKTALQLPVNLQVAVAIRCLNGYFPEIVVPLL